MFLTCAQRIVTGFFLTWWYGLPILVVTAVFIGWPAVILLVFWTGLLIYLGVRAFVRVRAANPT